MLKQNVSHSKTNKKPKKRKYSLEKEIIDCQIDFAPKIKPIKMKLVPSKFYLNKKNKNEKYNSCPCLDCEDLDNDEDEIFQVEGKNVKKSIKDTRKDLLKTKDNDAIPHALTKQVINNDNILEDEKLTDNMIFGENFKDNDFDIFPDIEPIGEKTPKLKMDYDKLIKKEKDDLCSFNVLQKPEKLKTKKKHSTSIINELKMKYNNNQ